MNSRDCFANGNGRTALYRHFAEDGSLLWVGVTRNPLQRLAVHHGQSPFGENIARVEIKWFDSREEAEAAEHDAILSERPRFNASAARRGMPKGYRLNRGPVTPLAFWLKEAGISQVEFAERVSVHPVSINRFCRGNLRPSRPVAVLIEQATNGAVPASSWTEAA